ncbi:unnamed protein product [Effrenium voratum]|nr:unnamed protein product [Effrenium voratum]
MVLGIHAARTCRTFVARWTSDGTLAALAVGARTLDTEHDSRSGLRASARAAQWEQALLIWRLRNSPGRGLCHVLQAAGRGRAWRLVLGLLSAELERPSAGLVAFNAGLAALAAAQQWRPAVHLLGLLPSSWMSPDVVSYTATMEAAARSLRWPLALELLQEAEATMEPDVIAWNTGISACEKVGQWTLALDLLRRLRRRLTPQVASFNAAAAACARALQWEMSLWLIFVEMRRDQARLRPTVVSFNVALTACERGQRWADALALLEAMPRRKVAPSAASCGAVAAALEKAAQGRRALALLKRMQQLALRANAVVLNSVITACEKQVLWQQALRLLNASLASLEEEGGAQVQVQGTVTCGAAIQACQRALQWQWALHLSSDSQASDAICLASVAAACARARKWRSAVLQTARLMQMGPRALPASTSLAATGTAIQAEHLKCLPFGHGGDRDEWWEVRKSLKGIQLPAQEALPVRRARACWAAESAREPGTLLARSMLEKDLGPRRDVQKSAAIVSAQVFKAARL